MRTVARVRTWGRIHPFVSTITVVAASLLFVLGALRMAAALTQPITSVTAVNYQTNMLTNYTLSGGQTAGSETISNTTTSTILTFPADFDLSNVTAGNVRATFSYSGNTIEKVGNTIKIRWGWACPANTSFDILIDNVRNPSHPAPGSAYSVEGTITTSAESSTFRQGLAAPITAGTGFPQIRSLVFGNTNEGAATTVTIVIRPSYNYGRISGDTAAGPDLITVKFPAGTVLSGTLSADDVTIGGLRPSSVSVSGTVVTLGMPAGLTIPNYTDFTVQFARRFGFVAGPAGSVYMYVNTSADSSDGGLYYNIGSMYSVPPTIWIENSFVPAGGWVRPGLNALTYGFTIQRIQGTSAVGTVQGVTFSDAGVNGADPGRDVATAILYRDDGDWVFDAGDTEVDRSTFRGSTLSFDFWPYETADSTRKQFWVVFQMSGTPRDGDTLAPWLTSFTALASPPVVNQAGPWPGAPVFRVDAAGPSVTFTQPPSDAFHVAAGPLTASGTATDGNGVSWLKLKIRRESDGWWWTGSGWQALETTIDPVGTSPWSYSWPAAAGATDVTYTVSAVAADGLGQVSTTQRSVVLDGGGPALLGAKAYDPTHVDVTFSEKVETATAEVVGRYSVPGLPIMSAKLLADGATVRLETGPQDPRAEYVLTASGLRDLFGHVMAEPATCTFLGSDLLRISLEAWKQPSAAYVATGTTVVVDGFSAMRTLGSVNDTMTAVRVEDAGDDPAATVAGVCVYRDDGDGLPNLTKDARLNSVPATFTASETTVTFDAAKQQAIETTASHYWVAYTFAADATNGAKAVSRIAGVSHAGDSADIRTAAGATFTVDTFPTSLGIITSNQPTAGYGAPGQARVVDGFTMRNVAGIATVWVSSITVRDTQTKPWTVIGGGVDIYRDDNGNGKCDVGTDTKLNSTPGWFPASTDVVVNLDTPEPVTSDSRQYFVVYTIGTNNQTWPASFNSKIQAVTSTAAYISNGTLTSGQWWVDPEAPSLTMDKPLSNTVFFSGVATDVTGVASDSRSGLATVGVSVQRSSDGRYWNRAARSWDTTAVYNGVSGSGSYGTLYWYWTWDFDPASQDGSPAYTLTSRAVDAVGNVTTLTASPLIVNNTGDPTILAIESSRQPATSTVSAGGTRLADGFKMRTSSGTETVSVRSISVRAGGTAPAGALVTGVDVYRDSNGNATYDAGVDAKLNASSASFVDDTAVVVLSTPEPVTSVTRQYWVTYRFANTLSYGAQVDSYISGASHTGYALTDSAVRGNPIVADTLGPAVQIVSPTSGSSYYGDRALVSGLAGDDLSALAWVGVAVQRTDTNEFWDAVGYRWVSTTVYNAVSGTNSWTFDWRFVPAVQAGAPYYNLFAQARDAAGNVTNATPVTMINVDNTLEPSTIALHSGSQPADAVVGRASTHAVDGFRMSRSAGGGSLSVSSVTVRYGGTAPASGIVSGVDVYRDENGDGVWEATRDTKLNGASCVFVGSDALVPFASAEPVTAAERQYFVVYRFSSLAADGALAHSTIVAAAHNATVLQCSSSAGNTFLVDAVPPAVTIASPLPAQTFDTTATIVRGTAEDTRTPVAGVDVSIRRSRDGLYWDGAAREWQSATAWNGADGSEDWRYRWEFDPPSQDGDTTYTVCARARDSVDNSATATVGELSIANGGPDTTAPSVPASVEATAGSHSPIVAVIAWQPSTDGIGVKSYKVWRSTTATGTYTAVGSAVTTGFSDESGVAGQRYFYKVSALDAAGNQSALSSPSGGVVATWTQPPHATYTDTDLCRACHTTHRAPGNRKLFRAADERETCYACHDGTGAFGNTKTGSSDSFALRSGHTVEESATGGDLTNSCSSCHSPHRDLEKQPRLAKRSINGTLVVGDDATWCLACHNDAQDWYVGKYGAYPDTTAPSRNASGYPVAGTFPGRTVYTDPSKNAHFRIPASSTPTTRAAGDCRYCHAVHRGASTFDALLATFTPPATSTVSKDRVDGGYAAACFACHDGSRETSGAPNIKRFVTKDGAAAGETSGHRIKSAGGLLPVNAPLPCYDCHNPHGSSRGNGHLLSDTLGANLDTTLSAGPEAVRRFCLTCHTTPDIYGWDSAAATYTIVGATAKVEGLRRDGGTSGSGPEGAYNWLRLKNLPGHRVADKSESCYACHGADYETASSHNVHHPSAGGGQRCYSCHDIYKQMDMADPAATSTHHHVLGSSPTSYSGDATTYPGATSQVYCLSCHADHDVFSDNVGANLRTAVGAPSTSVTNTDFVPGSSGNGVCLSCHNVALDKRNAYQKASPPGQVKTPVISASDYTASAHRYAVDSAFDTWSFRADCSKCHNDDATKNFQTSAAPARFGLHQSGESRLLAPFAFGDAAEERFCYGCHSKASEGSLSVWTPTSPTDRYGRATMSTAAVGIYSVEHKPYGHITSKYNNVHLASPSEETTTWLRTHKHVECADCHNPHAAKPGLHTKGSNRAGGVLAGVNGLSVTFPASGWTVPTQYSVVTSITYEYQVCLRCHSGANAGLSTWDDAQSAAWTDVALEFNPKNRSFHPVVAALNSPGSGSSNLSASTLGNGWTPGMTMTCSDCHGDDAYSPAASGPHGSAVDHLLKGPNRNWPNGSSEPLYGYYQLGLPDAQMQGLFCLNCHPNINSTDVSKTNSVHVRSNHRYSYGSNSTQHRGFCANCHIIVPHGGKVSRLIVTANTPARYRGDGTSYVGIIRQYAKPASAQGYINDNPWTRCNCDGGCVVGHVLDPSLVGSAESW